MLRSLANEAGSALVWKAVQHAGVKIVYLGKLLILARILLPDDFGLLAVSMVALDVMSRVTDLGMTPALVQRPHLGENHYNTAWTVGLLRAATIAAVVVLAAPLVARLFHEPRAVAIIQVLAIRPLLEASASIKVAELIRQLQFRRIALIQLPESLANAGVAIALAPWLGVWSLVAGSLAGPFTVLCISYVLAPHMPRFRFDRPAALSLIQFGRWIFVGGILAMIAGAALRLVISRQLGTAELGLYHLATSLAFLPVGIATHIVGDVTFPLYSRLQGQPERLVRAFQSVFTSMFAALLPVSMLLIVFAPDLVEHVLGPKWVGTVPIIRILAFVNLVGLFGQIVAPILKGVGRPSKVVAIEVVQTVMLVSLVWVVTARWGLSGAALAWFPAVAVSQFLGAVFLSSLLPNPMKGLGKPFSVIITISAAGASTAMLLHMLLTGFIGAIATAVLVGLGMIWLSWAMDHLLALGLTRDLEAVFPRIGKLTGPLRRSTLAR